MLLHEKDHNPLKNKAKSLWFHAHTMRISCIFMRISTRRDGKNGDADPHEGVFVGGELHETRMILHEKDLNPLKNKEKALSFHAHTMRISCIFMHASTWKDDASCRVKVIAHEKRMTLHERSTRALIGQGKTMRMIRPCHAG
jgi:hypothetical protein